MPTRPDQTERLYSRRKALGVLAASALGIAAGAAGLRVWQNESEAGPVIAEELLLETARRQLSGRRPFFGNHPDFDRPDFNPWQQADQVKEQVGREDFLGVFATVEQLCDRDWAANFLARLEQIHRRGAQPVIGLGYKGQIDGRHPFDRRAGPTRRQQADQVVGQLAALGFPVTLRLFYEMNLPSFVFGRGRGLADAQQEEGYREAFGEYADAARRRSSAVKLSFNPWVGDNFDPYWPEILGVLPDSAGLDGYHLFPGRGRWTHPLYWNPGNLSAEEVFLPSLARLRKLSRDRLLLYYWELGSLSKDAAWLSHAALLLYAAGGAGVLHFNYDKSSHGVPNEGDWTINPPVAAAYRRTLESLR